MINDPFVPSVDTFRNISRQRKFELIFVGLVGIGGIIGSVFVMQKANENIYNVKGQEKLQSRYFELMQQNTKLLEIIETKTAIIEARSVRDSVLTIEIRNTVDLLPGMNNDLKSINKKYENLSVNTRYSADELERYVTAEADRIRRESGNKR